MRRWTEVLGDIVGKGILTCALLGTLAAHAGAVTITWTGSGANGSWHTPSNWDLNRVPGSGDDVVIPDLAGTPSVTYSTGNTSIQSLACSEVLILSGGTLDIAGAFASTNSFTLSGGTLTGAGAFTLSGAYGWTAGTMSGAGTTTVSAGTTWTVSGGNQIILSRTLVNNGDCTWNSTNSINIASGLFRNASGGAFHIRNSQTMFNGGGGGSFENQAGATFEKSSTAGTTTIQGITLTNASTVNLQSGAFDFTSSGTLTNQGTIQTSAGTTLNYSSGTFNHPAGSSLLTQGTFNIFSNLTFDPAAIFTPGGLVAITSGTVTIPFNLTFPNLSLSGGTLTGAGNFTLNTINWTAGTMAGTGTTTIPAGTTWTVSGGNQIILSRTLVNNGDCTWNSTNSINIASGLFRNASGGAFHIRNSQTMFNGGGGGSFENQAGATFEKSSTAGTTTIQGITLTNASTINLQSGAFDFTSSGTLTNQGTIQTSAGTTLNYSSGTFNHPAGSSLLTQGTFNIFSNLTFDPAATFTPSGLVAITSGTTTIPFNLTFPNLSLSGGTLTGTGNFTLNTINWTAGTMAGAGTTTIPTGVTWTISGGNQIILSRTLVNNGDCTWNSTNSINIASGLFRNASGGAFHIRNSQAMLNGGGGGSFENQAGATFEKSSTAGTTTIQGITLTNASTINLQSGAFDFTSSGTLTNQGTIQTSAGTTLNYSSGTFNHPAGSSLLTQGTFNIFSNLTFDPAAIFTPGGLVAITSGTVTIPFNLTFPNLSLAGGVLTGAGSFNLNGINWTAGTMSGAGTTTVSAGTTWTVSGGNQIILSRTLVNNGDCTWNSTNSINIASGLFRNASGGAFHIRNSQAMLNGGGGGSFENQAGATFEKSSTAGTTTIQGITLTNASTINLQSGAFDFTSSGTLTNQGTIQTSAGTTLNYSSGTFNHPAGSSLLTQGTFNIFSNLTFDPAATFTPSGLVAITSGTTTIPFNLTFPNLSLAGGTLTGAGSFTLNGFAWTAGTMSGSGTTTIPTGISWTISGGNSITLSRTLVNSGACTWNSTNSISITNGIFRNAGGGAFHIRNDQTMFLGGGTGTLENQAAATIDKASSTGLTTLQNLAFNNLGTLNVATGTLAITGSGFQNFSGATITGGTYMIAGTFRFPGANIVTNAATIALDGPSSAILDQNTSANALAGFSTNAAGASFTILDGRNLTTSAALANAGSVVIGPGGGALTASSYTQTGGDTRLDTGTLAASGPLAINAGTLRGNGTVSGNLTNAGTVSPGTSPGQITVTGTYMQTSTGILQIELAGTGQGTSYDALLIGGTASINGTLQPSLINGFIPPPDTPFDILTAASLQGTFPVDGLPIAYTGGCLGGSYLPDRVRLVSHASVVIVQGPQSQTICDGTTATFSVNVTGSPTITFQWRKNQTNIQGATSQSLTIQPAHPADDGSYDVICANACGSLTSDPATLTVHTPAVITTQPQPQAVCPGANAVFTVAAQGDPPPTYQWRKNGNAISGAVQNTLTINGAGQGDVASYDAIVRNDCAVDTSHAAALSLKTTTAINLQPHARDACVGDSVRFSVGAAGTNLTYQWRKNTSPIGGATHATYLIFPVGDPDQATYDVVVQGDCGVVTSDPAALTVHHCTDQTGACCFPDNSCQVLVASACYAAGGMYGSDNSVCENYPCGRPAGVGDPKDTSPALPKVLTFESLFRADGSVSLQLALPYAANVHLTLFDVGGRIVGSLDEGRMEAGIYSIPVERVTGRRIASGIYFGRAQIAGAQRMDLRRTRVMMIR